MSDYTVPAYLPASHDYAEHCRCQSCHEKRQARDHLVRLALAIATSTKVLHATKDTEQHLQAAADHLLDVWPEWAEQ